MKRTAWHRWTWVWCLVICVGVVCFLIGRLSAGDAVRIQTEKRPASDARSGAEQPAEPAPDPAQAEEPQQSAVIDLNTAQKEDLMTLPRIGETLAERILDYREKNGGFVSTEQLMDVDGIGEGTYEGLRDLVTVEGAP